MQFLSNSDHVIWNSNCLCELYLPFKFTFQLKFVWQSHFGQLLDGKKPGVKRNVFVALWKLEANNIAINAFGNLKMV